MTGYIINLGYCIQLQDISIFSTKLRYVDFIIMEVIEFQPKNIIKKNSFYLSHGNTSSPMKEHRRRPHLFDSCDGVFQVI
jgi:hypothetical protein